MVARPRALRTREFRSYRHAYRIPDRRYLISLPCFRVYACARFESVLRVCYAYTMARACCVGVRVACKRILAVHADLCVRGRRCDRPTLI